MTDLASKGGDLFLQRVTKHGHRGDEIGEWAITLYEDGSFYRTWEVGHEPVAWDYYSKEGELADRYIKTGVGLGVSKVEEKKEAAE